MHPCTILKINPTRCTVLFSILISLLYMFPATMCPSSGEITISMRRWYLSLCMGGIWCDDWSETSTSTPDATHTEWQIPPSHRYSNFSWWWAHGCPKHVQKRNKYTKQNCAPSWIYLQASSPDRFSFEDGKLVLGQSSKQEKGFWILNIFFSSPGLKIRRAFLVQVRSVAVLIWTWMGALKEMPGHVLPCCRRLLIPVRQDREPTLSCLPQHTHTHTHTQHKQE